MSDSSDEYTQTEAPTNDLEAARVARYFIYKNRERQGIRKPQLKPVLDEFREKSRAKRRDPIQLSSKLLTESMGLQIAEGLAPDEKSSTPKNFLVRTQRYPKECELPFSSEQMQEYGLMLFCFFIVYYKGNQADFDQVWQILESAHVPADSPVFGKWPDFMNKWISQDYFKAKKKDDDVSPIPKKVLSLGPRFYAEFSLDVLNAMAEELVRDKSIDAFFENQGAADHEEDAGDENSNKEDEDNEDSIEEPPPPEAPQRGKSKKSQSKKGKKKTQNESDLESE